MHKAGIIKQGVEVVVGEEAPHHVFQPISQDKEAPYIVAADSQNVTFKLQNEAIAKTIVYRVLERTDRLGALDSALNEVCQANQACRMEQLIINEGRQIVYIDVAHNESGIKAVLDEIKTAHPDKPIRVACAFSKMKEISKMIEMLLTQVNSVHFLAAPHFKLESIAGMYLMAETIASQR